MAGSTSAATTPGISPPDDDSILDTGLNAWERVQRVNLTSVYLCCKHALPHLLARGKGSIINIPPRSWPSWARRRAR